jgi:DNA (cytosine-5)-methyltransferase 1
MFFITFAELFLLEKWTKDQKEKEGYFYFSKIVIKVNNIQNTDQNIDNEGLSWVLRKFQYPQRTIRIATSFSGIGAIEYAFKRLGLHSKIVFAGDIDANCKKSYFANYDIKEEQWHTDISKFNATPYKGKVDLFVGGAPCQAFSIVGDQLGFDDTRGTLFREFARVVKECQPKVFIFENVQGLFKHDNGRTWEVIYNTFKDYCGYDIHYQLLNARDYGIPQTRERLYCVGFQKETSFKYPAPIPLKYKMYDFLEDYKDSEYYVPEKKAKILSPDEKQREKVIDSSDAEQFNDFIFEVKDVEDKYYLSEKVAKYVLCSGTKTFKTPIKTDLDIARPLLHSMHKMHRAGVDNYVTFNKSKGVNGLRKLTPRECFRLMGFKDDFKIEVSNTSAYMEAGNSIVVDVLIALLKQMDITKYGIDNDQ